MAKEVMYWVFHDEALTAQLQEHIKARMAEGITEQAAQFEAYMIRLFLIGAAGKPLRGGASRMSKRLTRNEMIRLLVDQLGRHRPRWLPVKTTVQVIRRLIARAFPAEGGCILFDGNLNNHGYARLNVRLHGNHTSIFAHRIVCQLAHDGGDIPHWKEAAHACDCPPCMHPGHVELQRRRENRVKSALNSHRKMAQRRAAEQRAAA